MAGLLRQVLGGGAVQASESVAGSTSPAAWLSDLFFSKTSGLHRNGPLGNDPLTVPTIYACVKILAETMATLPRQINRIGPQGAQPAPDHPAYRWFTQSPNRFQTPMEFWEMMLQSVAIRGNGYAEKFDLEEGLVTIPLHPDRVTPILLSDGRCHYKVLREDGVEDLVLFDEMLHIRTMSRDGITGMPLTELMARAFNIAKNLDQHGEAFFENGSAPGGVLQHPGKLTEEAKKDLRESFEARHQGARKARRIAVLDQGLTWTTVDVSNADAQWLEARDYQAQDIARIFRIPQHMVGILSRSTNNNIEHQGIEFGTHTISPWVIRFEEAIQRDILRDPAYAADFDIDLLLRGDYYSRQQGLQLEFQNGVITQNEWREENGRRREDDPEANKRYINRTLIPVDQLTKLAQKEIDAPVKAPGSGMKNEKQPKKENGRPPNSDALTAWVADIAHRLSAATCRELGKHVKHQATEPAKFQEFLTEHFASRINYTEKAVQPLFSFLGFDQQRLDEAVSAICTKTQFSQLPFSEYVRTIQLNTYLAIMKELEASDAG